VGSRAAACFLEAERLAGVLGKMRLASMCSITSGEASTIPETPELLERLEQGLQRLREQFGQRSTAPASAPLAPDVEVAQELRRHVRAHLDLLSQRELWLRDPQAAIRRVDEVAAATLRVHRVSVWLLEEAPLRIRCVDLFERAHGRHSAGLELAAADFPSYFEAIATERTIAAHDAMRDPRTACFAESYLGPLQIESMLDVPIWATGRMRGVVCHEHIGAPRVWNADEETFAYLMSSFVGLALELAEGGG
jgi:hypothetical protein